MDLATFVMITNAAHEFVVYVVDNTGATGRGEVYICTCQFGKMGGMLQFCNLSEYIVGTRTAVYDHAAAHQKDAIALL